MSQRQVPQEAVEAATRSWWKGFDRAEPDYQRAMLADHRLALEAAYPAIRLQVLEKVWAALKDAANLPLPPEVYGEHGEESWWRQGRDEAIYRVHATLKEEKTDEEGGSDDHW